MTVHFIGAGPEAGMTLAIHLAIQSVARVVTELIPFYGADCPAAVVARVSWPDQEILRGKLATISQAVSDAGLDRTALILVGSALAADDFRNSALYSVDFQRRDRGR